MEILTAHDIAARKEKDLLGVTFLPKKGSRIPVPSSTHILDFSYSGTTTFGLAGLSMTATEKPHRRPKGISPDEAMFCL
jgi:hypothetical protein